MMDGREAGFETLSTITASSVDILDGKAQFHGMPFDREQMKTKAAELAAQGVFIGTSRNPSGLGNRFYG